MAVEIDGLRDIWNQPKPKNKAPSFLHVIKTSEYHLGIGVNSKRCHVQYTDEDGSFSLEELGQFIGHLKDMETHMSKQVMKDMLLPPKKLQKWPWAR